MLKLHWVEIFLRGTPEMLLIIWGIYEIARKAISLKILILFSTIMGIVVFFIRMLPIHFGVHTFILVILTICFMSVVGITIVNAIYGTLAMILLLFISEFVNLGILVLLDINFSTLSPVTKSVAGIPSLVMMYLLIIAIRCWIKPKGTLKSPQLRT